MSRRRNPAPVPEREPVPPATPQGERITPERLAFIRSIGPATLMSQPDVVPTVIIRELLDELDRVKELLSVWLIPDDDD